MDLFNAGVTPTSTMLPAVETTPLAQVDNRIMSVGMANGGFQEEVEE